MLMAADIEVPRRVGIHGFLLLGEHKMSKSLGNVIEPFQVAEIYGADALRFYLMREVSFGSDGEVSPEGFETRYTTELANEYGNLASRTLAMIARYRDGVVPDGEPPAGAPGEFDGLAEAVRGRLDAIELTAALDEIWQRVKLLNRYVQDEEPWQLSKDESAAERLDQVLYSLAEGLRVVSCCCTRSCPARPSGCCARWVRKTLRSSEPSSGRSAAALRSRRSGSSSRAWSRLRSSLRSSPRPDARAGQLPVIDTHCHLDHCDAGTAELVERARAAGLTRLATVGTDAASIERALQAAGEHEEVYAIVGRHPHETSGFDAAAVEEIERLAADPKVRAIGETGLDYYRDHAPRDDQRRAFEAQLELAGRLGLPVAIHTRAAEEDTFALLREHDDRLPAVILHCFSAPDRLGECVERGYLCSFAGNVTYPKATDLQQAAREVPDELLLVETDSPYLSPQPVRGKRNEPANVVHTARHLAELRGVDYAELEQTVERNAARVFGW